MKMTISCAFISVLLIATLPLSSCSVKNHVKSSSLSIPSSSSHLSNSSSSVPSSTDSNSSSSLVDKNYFTVADASKITPQSKLFNKDGSVDFTFYGHKYNLPNCKLSDFKADGFSISTIDDQKIPERLKPKTYTVIRLGKKGIADLTIANTSNKALDSLDCNVVGVEFRAAWIEDNSLYGLPLGVEIDNSIEKIRSVYGEPEKIHIRSAIDSGKYIDYVYQAKGNNFSNTIDLFFNPDSYGLFLFDITVNPTDCTLVM